MDVLTLREDSRSGSGVDAAASGGSAWFVGEGVTLADIALSAYTHVCEAGGFRLRDDPAVCTWLARGAGLKGYVAMDS